MCFRSDSVSNRTASLKPNLNAVIFDREDFGTVDCATIYKTKSEGDIMKGIFGDLFDFNHNGKLDPGEQAMEFALLQTIIDVGEKEDAVSVEKLNDFDIMDDD